MIRDIESLRAAQQMLSTNAINQLNASINNFQLLKLIDGRETRGRQALAEQLITIEDRLLIVKNQIETIRNLYKEM
ncbi:hypothetical protein H318_14803 [Enterococcus durans IPLA 655]|uniref:hypothetical protein n=1 Tax=Enterococcus durans TaxID=53345 RepID=UPI00032849E5|nr:hypothetical protein [Enterococcus durans]EMS74345.1 hypothetical protein H318_14803 [Enterococcus durans IPLA 655]